MANQWVRLWVDMPNDPKWRTVSRISKQPISLVISVFVHLMCDAANASERGVTQCDAEDVASALDVETDQVLAVLDAMNGRVLDGRKLIGWDKRQPTREDDSRERTRAYRERMKTVTQCDAPVTQCDAPDTDTDTDTDTEIKRAKALMSGSDEKSPASDASKEVLDYMNERSGKRFKPTKSNLSLIKARLSEHSQTELCGVIDRKVQEWAGTEFEQYIRPATVFGAQKCSQYVGELGQPIRRKTNGKRPCTFESQGIEIPKF